MRAPRGAYAYWLATLDAPILLCSAAGLGLLLWKLKTLSFNSRQIYAATWIVVLAGTALTAHVAGRETFCWYVICVSITVILDDCISNAKLRKRIAAAVTALAAGNMAWASINPRYTPQVAVSGYRHFVAEYRDALVSCPRNRWHKCCFWATLPYVNWTP